MHLAQQVLHLARRVQDVHALSVRVVSYAKVTGDLLCEFTVIYKKKLIQLKNIANWMKRILNRGTLENDKPLLIDQPN